MVAKIWMFSTIIFWCQIPLQNTSQPKSPIHDKAIPSLCFRNKNTKGIPIQKLRNCHLFGVYAIIFYWRQTPNPPQKITTTNQQKIPFATTNQSRLAFFVSKKFERPQPPTPPKKHFLTNFLAEILCQKDGRRSPRVLQPKVQSLQWIHAQDL